MGKLNIDNYKKCPNTKIFIETGTFHGGGVKTALSSKLFNRIISIEVDENFYKNCLNKFKDELFVELYLGESVEVLPGILSNLNDKAIFWLDAHPQGGAIGKIKHPLITEINIIKSHNIPNHYIFIDDARLFQNFGTSIDTIITLLKTFGDNYQIDRIDTECGKGDIIFAYPVNS